MQTKVYVITDDLIFGAQVHNLINNSMQKYKFSGFILTERTKVDPVNSIIGDLTDFPYVKTITRVVIAIKDSQKRKEIFKHVKKNEKLELVNIFHKDMQIGSNVKFSKGIIIFGDCQIQQNVKIQKNVILMPFAKIEAGARIEKYCTLLENACVGSGAIMLKESTLGRGSNLFSRRVLNKSDGIHHFRIFA